MMFWSTEKLDKDHVTLYQDYGIFCCCFWRRWALTATRALKEGEVLNIAVNDF